MNANDIIKSGIFSDAEDWTSFLELADQRGNIGRQWLKQATVKLRQELQDRLTKEWCMLPFGDVEQDTKFFLDEFGEASVYLMFGWQYKLLLRLNAHEQYDSDKINEFLGTKQGNVLVDAFTSVDLQFQHDTKLAHGRNFSYGSVNDGDLSSEETAWFAGNRTDEFVKQCIEMIEKFTCSDEVTSALRELHLRCAKTNG